MKIMHIITTAGLGGAQTVVQELIEKAVEENNEVILVSDTERFLWENLSSLNITCYPLKFLKNKISPSDDLKVFFKIIQIYKKEKPDIIHLHSAKAGFLGRAALFLQSKKIVYTQHGFDSILINYPKFLIMEKIVDPFSFKQIAVSHYDKKNLISKEIKGGAKGIQVIYNGISPFPLIEEEKLPLLENFLRLRFQDKKIILSLSRFDTTKNDKGEYNKQQKDLKLTCEVLTKLGEDFHLFWMGNFGETPKDIPQNITLLGSVANAKYYLPYCDLFLLLSNHEGLPMSILEAMSVKTPIFASAVGGIPEIIKEEKTGFLDKVKNPELIAHKIKKAFENPQKLNQITKEAFNLWEEKLTSRTMWTNYKKIYKEIYNPS